MSSAPACPHTNFGGRGTALGLMYRALGTFDSRMLVPWTQRGCTTSELSARPGTLGSHRIHDGRVAARLGSQPQTASRRRRAMESRRRLLCGPALLDGALDLVISDHSLVCVGGVATGLEAQLLHVRRGL
jgi:hypothetical protein